MEIVGGDSAETVGVLGALPPAGDPQEQEVCARRLKPTYTHPRQRSPNAGRLRFGRHPKKQRREISLWTLTQCSNEELWPLGVRRSGVLSEVGLEPGVI